MTRLLFPLFVFSLIIIACKKSDDPVDSTIINPPAPQSDCPDFEGVPPIQGWEQLEIEISNFNFNLRTYFLTEEVGFFFGSNNGLFRTTNRGEQWENIGNQQWIAFQDMYFLEDKMHGFLTAQNAGVIGSSLLLKTTDGGLTWEEIPLSSNTVLSQIFFTDELNGIGIIHIQNTAFPSLALAKTNDGGLTWSEFAGVIPQNNYDNNLHIFPDGFGYLAGTAGRIFKTVDYGQNWEVIHTGLIAISRVQFLDAMNGFIYGAIGLYKTTDGGENWEKILDNIIENFHFFSPNEGIVIQVSGFNSGGDVIFDICKNFATTTDGGITWTESESSKSFDPNHLFFLNENLGFMALENNNVVVLERE